VSFRILDIKDGEAPAKTARRHFRWKIVLSLVATLPLIGTIAILERLLETKIVVVIISLGIGLSYIAFFGSWKEKAPCPRCGWDINRKKQGYPFMATFIPSNCPDCHLDLERPYQSEKASPHPDSEGRA